MSSYPLVVDLDGTLIRTDMLHESAIAAVHAQPLVLLRIPFWLASGKAVLKQQLSGLAQIDPEKLPYHTELLDWLKQKQAEGTRLILCTASDQSFANAINEHLGIFDEVIASDGTVNVSGHNKAEILQKRFGRGGFDYVANSYKDLPVWQQARRAIVVNAGDTLVSKAAKLCEVEKIFPKSVTGFSTWRRMLRLHQWLKNLLLFVPLLAAHELTNIDHLISLLLAFFSFSLCASSVYITNDLLDLDSDRQHPRKCKRPFASGQVPIQTGVILAPLLLLTSLLLAWQVGSEFFIWLIAYFVLTCIYSLILKRLLLLDCLTLAMLYTLRIIAGAAAAHNTLSFWLLAFAVFLFLSLAFVKRYAELEIQLLSGQNKVHGRGYYTTDAPLIQSLGVTSGYASVLVLALYLNSEAVIKLYQAPEIIWGTVPVLLFWISWMWMQAHRGKMHDDPLVFTITDKASLLAGAIFAVIVVLGSTGWSW